MGANFTYRFQSFYAVLCLPEVPYPKKLVSIQDKARSGPQPAASSKFIGPARPGPARPGPALGLHFAGLGCKNIK